MNHFFLHQWEKIGTRNKVLIPIFLFLLVFFLRVFFCAQAPIETSDLYRHLGFTSHFFENPKNFYSLLPSQFPHEFWSQFWPEQGYIYPPLALLFFAVFGTFGIGLFWVKFFLTLFDAVSAILIARSVSWWAALLVFSSPVSVWYTSHEGQYESMVTLLIVITVFSARGGYWKTAGVAFMLALQAKQLAVLIVPYLAFEIVTHLERGHLQPLKGFILGFLGAFLPFAPMYFWRPDIWFLPLQTQHEIFNSFYWPVFWNQHAMHHFDECSHFRMVWNTVVTTAPLFVMAVFLARGKALQKLPQAMPSLAFWLLLKSLPMAQSWYTNYVPGFTFALWRYKPWMILLLAIYWLQCGQQVAALIGDIDLEEKASVTRFQKCLWVCDYRAPS